MLGLLGFVVLEAPEIHSEVEVVIEMTAVRGSCRECRVQAAQKDWPARVRRLIEATCPHASRRLRAGPGTKPSIRRWPGDGKDTDTVSHAETPGFGVVTADTGSPIFLSLRRATSPSVVLLPRVTELTPTEHAKLLLANLPTVTKI